MLLPISDLSPVSMVPREHDNLNVAEAMKINWETRTTYLGEADIQLRSVQNELLSIETFHVFSNNFGFLHMEQNYFHEGGAHGSQTLYLFRK